MFAWPASAPWCCRARADPPVALGVPGRRRPPHDPDADRDRDGLPARGRAAVAAAVAMDRTPAVRRAVEPILVTSQTIPIVALAPLFLLWFGFGLAPKVLVVILVTFFPIVVALLDGFGAVRPDATDLMRSYGATDGQAFRLLRWPSALPYLFTGLRISVVYAVIGAVFGEYVGAREGLGIWMQLSAERVPHRPRVRGRRGDLGAVADALLGGRRAAAGGHPVGTRRRTATRGAVRGRPRRSERFGVRGPGLPPTCPRAAAATRPRAPGPRAVQQHADRVDPRRDPDRERRSSRPAAPARGRSPRAPPPRRRSGRAS